MDEQQKKLAKVIENYFGADAGYLDISCLDLARAILEAGWTKPVPCEECRHYDSFCGVCQYLGSEHMAPSDFCSYGERREKK